MCSSTEVDKFQKCLYLICHSYSIFCLCSMSFDVFYCEILESGIVPVYLKSYKKKNGIDVKATTRSNVLFSYITLRCVILLTKFNVRSSTLSRSHLDWALFIHFPGPHSRKMLVPRPNSRKSFTYSYIEVSAVTDTHTHSHTHRRVIHNSSKGSEVKLHIQATFASPDGSEGTSCCVLCCWWIPSAKNMLLWRDSVFLHQKQLVTFSKLLLLFQAV